MKHKAETKLDKDLAFYIKAPGPKGEACVKCVNFQPIEGTSPRAGLCEQVFGIVDEVAHCDEYVAKLGEGRVQNGDNTATS